MAEVIIHRCTLRLVRRRGWSWGAAPQHLLKAAVAALPLLIARRLGELLPDATDAEISERVCLTVPINLSELLVLGAEVTSRVETRGPPSNEAFDQRVTAAVASALAGHFGTANEETQTDELAKDTPDFEAPHREEKKIPGHHVLRLLLKWRSQGELEVHLASFTEQELEAWNRALLATVLEFASTAKGVPTADILRVIDEITKRLHGFARNRLPALRLSLSTLLEAGAQLQRESIDDVALREVFAQVCARFDLLEEQRPTTKPPEQIQANASGDEPPLGALPNLKERAVMPGPPQAPVQRLVNTDRRIRSVLPFLLLGPLARIGYLDALAAALEAMRLSDEAHVFATALAFKVLSPPARGWRRADEDLLVAAAFAGVEAPPTGDALAELARKMSGHLAALDSLVAYTLIKGHRPGKPLLLHRARQGAGPEGLLLVETEGVFPIAWGNDLPALTQTLKYLTETPLLIGKNSADVKLLRGLHESGFRFITDAPPTRGESWRELRRMTGERGYSNDIEAKETTLMGAAEKLSIAAEETELLWQALAIDRPSIPTVRNSELEQSLTIAASLALGTISWMLWRDRETVTPMLALERFSNLEGRVRFTSSAIQVHLPLGRRQRDLYEHRLLAEVPNIPWLDGRTVEFTGG